MISANGNTITNTTSPGVVLPFYIYAALSFLVAATLLLLSTSAFLQHYFHPFMLAITHSMALGWGTMIILGASHQLVPVLIEEKLYSNLLGYVSFFTAAAGIPLLVYGFYIFHMGWPAQYGGWLILVSILSFLLNIGMSIEKSRQENVHAIFVFTAVVWLAATIIVGLVLVYNFTHPLLDKSSLHYLSLHAHLGIAGWFLLMICGVGSRLIPMFLISKYNNTRQLWWIYFLINGGLLFFVIAFVYTDQSWLFIISILAVIAAIVVFGLYCYKSYQQRIRKKLDEQMKISLLSVLMMVIPVVFLVFIFLLMMISPGENIKLVTSYGFIIFFGWITSIILGMTFKTLPFIVWNKVYHHIAANQKNINPKDMFSNAVFNGMSLVYIAGFVLFVLGILLQWLLLMNLAAVLLWSCAILYNLNVFRIIMHKPVSA